MTLAIVCALTDELRPILAMMAIESQTRWESAVIYSGHISNHQLIVAKSGMGRKRMERAVGYLIENHGVDSVISIGFGGGLSPKLHIGDLVLSTQIFGSHSGAKWVCDKALLEATTRAIEKTASRHHSGGIVAVDKVSADPMDKAFLGTSHDGLVVDMESEGLAVAATSHGIPFLAVRAVFDPMEIALPDFSTSISADGNFRPFAFAAHLIRNPRDIKKLPQFYYASEKCKRNLRAFVAALTNL